MIKKIFITIAIIWFFFLAVLVFREQIIEFLGEPMEVEKTVQNTAPPVVETIPVPVPKTEIVKETKTESIPFAPLPSVPKASPVMVEETKQVKQEVVKQEASKPNQVNESKKPENSFGLICTKFEKVPSRFRLVGWEGRKKVELEDLSKVDSSTKKHPRIWLRVRVPYKEFMHPTSKESFFRPTTLQDPNKRIIVQSFEVKEEKMSYTGRVNPIGYSILRDFKLGGPPYQITSEMEQPLTTSYYLHFEQNMGPQKFFHDLTGKPFGYKFGGWGLEYKITKQNFAQNKITVLRKEIKTGKLLAKELQGPSSIQ